VINVAVLGAGFMGSTHARAIKSMPNVQIASIYGLSENRAKPLADELAAPWTTDLEQIFADQQIDAIDICLPGLQHREATERALAAGKHVLLEKPIAVSADDADAIVALAERSDRVCMIAHVLRFWPEYVALHRDATSGKYGRPRQALAYRRQAFPAWSALFARSDLTGGAVIDMMIHDVDALNWILGTPRSVVARGTSNPKSGGYDQVQMMIDYGDTWAQVDGGMMMPESYPFTSSLQVLCDSGALEYNFQAGGRSVEMGVGRNEYRVFPDAGDPETVPVEQADAYAAEIAYWIDCIESGKRADRATPADARLALKTVFAARTSIEAGGLLAVPV
jgi:predicted dehydrogenase